MKQSQQCFKSVVATLDTPVAASPPIRIQMSRRKGWRKPANTAYVGRPSGFGNPFRRQEHGLPRAVNLYEGWIRDPAQAPLLEEARRILRGKNLGCWCPIGGPCHADVLLRLVNI